MHPVSHAPQFDLSLWRSTQAFAFGQNVSPPRHVGWHDPFEHAIPDGQTSPHAPQFALSLFVFAQNTATPSNAQGDWPGAQVELHAPSTHAWPLGHFAAHAPQLSRSTFGSTHD